MFAVSYCRSVLSVFLAVAATSISAYAELRAFPDEIALNRVGAIHGLLVQEVEGATILGVPSGVEFSSANLAVATVDALGRVTAVGDGETTIKATANGETVEAKVRVSGRTQSFQPSFRNHIQPVLYKMGCNTGACHGAAAGKNGFKLSLRGFDHDLDHRALTRQAKGRRVSLAEPEASLILLKPTMSIPHEGGERFEKDSEPYALIREWIIAGAPKAKEDDPRIERIAVYPPNVTLGAGVKQPLLVQAHYSDGTYADVTRWAKFSTTDESVVIVDDLGGVTVQGPGAAAISVWYSSRVNAAQVVVPRADAISPEVFAKAPRANFIDEHVLAQLSQLRIAPAAKASDAEFVRRAYLDATGVLPTSDESFAFVMDNRPDKQARLVDALLERPEFVDYWSYKWSDLLLVSSRNLPRREDLTAFNRFIRESVTANKPWDQFARDLLTATGSTQENGAANYFAMHKETIDLTETTSLAFLGMSITCARCHNHPLEKWTQDDYYGMANLFSQVKLKNGKNGGDIDVLADPFGNIPHPRLGVPVPPKPLDGEAIPLDQPGDRRETLVKWLTSSDNPYFTRAIVNRVWKNFMGRGLVEPVDDLRLTNPATNQPLFEALTADFVEKKFDVKQLIRTIMNSAAYQRSSQSADPNVADEKYYSAYIIRRLDAEVILDAYSAVTAVPTAFDGYPGGFRALQLPDSQVGSYFLTAFGRPEREQTCSCERTEDSSVAQALHIANGDTLNGKLRDANSMVSHLLAKGLDDKGALEDIYLRALGRFPSPGEMDKALPLLASAAVSPEERRLGFEDVAWAVLTSKEFLFNH